MQWDSISVQSPVGGPVGVVVVVRSQAVQTLLGKGGGGFSTQFLSGLKKICVFCVEASLGPLFFPLSFTGKVFLNNFHTEYQYL
jgi:hypothetical protein